MPKAIGNIIKANNVEFEGQFHLDVAKIGQNSSTEKRAKLAVPKVGIVENNPEYAVIEVTCGCGAKTYLRCEYTDSQASEKLQTQNAASAVSDQIPDEKK